MFLTLLLGGCSLFGGDPAEAIAAAETALKNGDMTAASAAYDAALKDFPTSVDVAVGAAYVKVLAGDANAADAILGGVEASAEERVGEVKVRRALLAVQLEDLDKVKAYGKESNVPLGALLAAEAELADGNREAARPLLETAKAAPGPVGVTAGQYLTLMADTNPLVAGLSEAQALWALGQRVVAVQSVGDLVRAYAETREDGADQLLVWAGRSAAMGKGDIAVSLLDSITVSPAGQKWRVDATRAMAACASGDSVACIAGFDALDALAASTGGAIPSDGLADARATAAMVIAGTDPASARKLVENLRGDAAARVLAQVGDAAAASTVVADPFFKSQLGG